MLIPAAIVYTLFARLISGPGFTTAPNQGAMVVFFLMVLAWPLIAIFLLALIGRIFGIGGVPSILVAFVVWAFSSIVPFIIGM